MNEERTRILEMLAAGKITPQETERLLDALQAAPDPEPAASTSAEPPTGPRKNAKFMYVKVPLSLARAGLRLTSLIPPQAMAEIDRHMDKRGVSMDFANLRPADIEELIDGLTDTEVNVDSKNGDKVRVFCA